MPKKTIRELDITGKRVLVRVDFNVPMANGEIKDDTRIKAAIPTLKYLLDKGGKLVIMSHLGRPKGEVKEEMRLTAVGKRLNELLDGKITKLDEIIGENVEKVVNNLKEGYGVLLENIRFNKGETKCEEEFVKALVKLGDVCVNDAFGTAHRAHASNAGIAKYLPSAVGFLMEKEIKFIGDTIENPVKPFIAILGGAKVSGKINVINNLLNKVDAILIGGGMAFTFYKAMGLEIGTSLIEEDRIDVAKNVLEQAEKKGVKLVLPTDIVVAKEFNNDSEIKTVAYNKIPEGWMGLDCGPDTLSKFEEILKPAKTVIWNGPMGVFEMSNFAVATNKLAEMVANLEGTTIVGGGDSVSAVNKSGYASKISHISTGGGASLEMMEGKELPGVASIDDIEQVSEKGA